MRTSAYRTRFYILTVCRWWCLSLRALFVKRQIVTRRMCSLRRAIAAIFLSCLNTTHCVWLVMGWIRSRVHSLRVMVSFMRGARSLVRKWLIKMGSIRCTPWLRACLISTACWMWFTILTTCQIRVTRRLKSCVVTRSITRQTSCLRISSSTSNLRVTVKVARTLGRRVAVRVLPCCF